MAKSYTKEEVSAKVETASASAEVKGVKSATKHSVTQLKAEIERTKASDLGKSEKKAAIAALKNSIQAINSPFS